MTRILIVIGLTIAIVWWLRKGRSPHTPKTRTPPAPQALLRCAHCGVMVPADEAFRDPQNRAYCSPAHLTQGNAKN